MNLEEHPLGTFIAAHWLGPIQRPPGARTRLGTLLQRMIDQCKWRDLVDNFKKQAHADRSNETKWPWYVQCMVLASSQTGTY